MVTAGKPVGTCTYQCPSFRSFSLSLSVSLSLPVGTSTYRYSDSWWFVLPRWSRIGPRNSTNGSARLANRNGSPSRSEEKPPSNSFGPLSRSSRSSYCILRHVPNECRLARASTTDRLVGRRRGTQTEKHGRITDYGRSQFHFGQCSTAHHRDAHSEQSV